MGDRKTPKWMQNSEGAFGAKGAKGDRGERKASDIFKAAGYKTEHCPKDRTIQLQGIDFFVIIEDRRYGVDVKNNLRTGGDVGVQRDKILSSQAHFWIHINDKDPNDYIMYKVGKMRMHILTLPFNPPRGVHWVPRSVVDSL